MSSRFLRRNGRKLGVAATAAALGLSGLALSASPASALPGFEFERLAGEDRIETAVDISSNTFTTSDSALIARADLFPDALAGNYLAGAQQDPILLSHTDEVPAETLAELERLGATSVTLLGGTDALSDDVAAALEAEGYTVTREAGTDRYETAADIAQSQDAATIGEVDGLRTALLATGENFPDALTGGPLAYAGNHPILLTPSAELGDDAAAALEALGIEQVLILGGTAAVSQSAEDAVEAMGITTQRLAGNTRYDTATDIAEFALAELGFTDAHINVATGMKFPDALTGGPHAGEEVTPIILANDGNTAEAVAYLEAHVDTLVDGHIYGGTAAVSQAVEDELEAAAAGEDPTTNQTFTASTVGDEVVELGAGGTGGTRDITFTGVGDGPVDVALVPCYDDEIQDDAGFFTFLDQDEDNLYDVVSGSGETRMGNAELISVNSEPAGSTTFDDNAAAESGAVTVRVRSTDVDCVRVLVWDDADDDDALDLDAANQPSEAFGISDMLVWHNGEAPEGTDPHSYIVYIDKDANFFVLEDGFLYNYDAGDIFGYDDVDPEDQITLAEFELAANNNRFHDEIDMQSTFGYTTTGQNRYALDHEESNIPTDLTATTSGDLDDDADDSDTTFTWAAPSPPNGLIENYTVEVYDDAGQVDCDTGVLAGTATSAGSATTVTVEDLGDGDFCALVYATTFDGNDSYDSEPVRFTVDTGQAPIITSATLTDDAVTEGEADTGDVWTLEFNEEMNPATVAGSTFTLTDVDGDSILVECKAAAADTVTDATCVLGNGADATVANDTLVITLAEDGQDRNAAGDGDILYPLTITASTGLTDLDDGDTVNVAGSTDVTIG